MSRIEHLSDSVTLHLGDCRKILPTLPKFDACVTDPPYGIDYGNQGSFQASHGWGPWRENVAWDAQRPERAIFDAMLACSKHQIIWGGNYFTDYLPPTMQWFIWDKGQRNFSLADFEIAWSSQEAASRIVAIPRAVARLDGKEHPTQKPIDLMCWCIEKLPPPAHRIVDPFMGSGTTGIAAVKLGRRFTGIEIHEPYFDIACRRITDQLSRPMLALEQPPQAKQEAFQYDAEKDFAGSLEEGYRTIRERVAAGGEPWVPKIPGQI